MSAASPLQRKYRKRGRELALIDAGWLAENEPDARAAAPILSARRDRMECRAALLAWFEPSAVLDPGEPVTVKDPDLADLLAACEIAPGPEGPRRRLRTDMRRAALARMGSRAAMQEVAKGLPAQPPGRARDPIQDMLDRVVAGASIDVARLDRSALAALLLVREWMEGILAGLPDAGAIRGRLAREDLVAPLRHLADNFIGREAELDRLRAHLGDVAIEGALRRGQAAIAQVIGGLESLVTGRQQSPLFVHGIGGVGKSTLVARFALDLAQQSIPFVFLDLDRPHLEPRNPITLLAEAARQLRVQLPDGVVTQKLVDDLDAFVGHRGGAHEAETVLVADPKLAVERFCAALQGKRCSVPTLLGAS